MMSKTFTAEEVAKHNTKDDCWVIVGDKVLNVTSFLEDHPGGESAIMGMAGKDATEEFEMLHDEDTIENTEKEMDKILVIGTLAPKANM